MHWTIDGHIVSDLLDENIMNGSEIWDTVDGYPFNITFVNKATGAVLTPDTPVSETVGTYKMTLTPKENVDIRKLTINGKRVKPVLAGEFIIRPLTEPGDNAAQKNAGIITDVVNEQPSAPVKGAAIAVINADTVYKINGTDLEPDSKARSSLIFDKLLDEETYGQQIETRLTADGRVSASKNNNFDMRYLDLVDANNGNVWISSSKGATIYWPYPEHTDRGTEFKLWHFKDIHREYDIEGRIGAEEGIKTSDIEEVPVERTDNGISFFVDDADFGIFVLTWTEKKPVDPGKPDNSDKPGYSDKPDKSGNSDKSDKSDKPGNNNTSGGSNGTGGSHGSGVSGGTHGADKSSGSGGADSSDKSYGSAGKGVSGGVVSGESYAADINGNWVHMSPDNVNVPISVNVPEGAVPLTDPEWHRWKFILNNGSMLCRQWAFIGNPYAANGQPSEGWFSFDESGIMNYGWYLDENSGKWYYLHGESDGMLGTMETGWHHDSQDGRWYYLDPVAGEMLLGWQQIDGVWYYFNPVSSEVTWNYNEASGGWTYNGSKSRPYGSMYAGELTPDGYTVNADGAMTD